MSIRVGHAAEAPSFPKAAEKLLRDTQLRHNVRHATDVIRRKRARVVEEMPDWEELRSAGHEIKEHTLRYLDFYLDEFERNCTAAGGKVHRARDADEANSMIADLIRSHGEREVIKVKTMTSDETGLNEALERAAITPFETDLADLIVQLGEDKPSHIVVPALHRNRQEIRQIFLKKMKLGELGERPEDLAAAARAYLREKFLRVKVGVTGANFLVAETGSAVVVESEGNGRMCVSLPRVLIALVGIEKVIPAFRDLEVFLQLLPRSATGERMNPYNSIWTGVSPGDGPEEFHVVLLDNGRANILADTEARATLDCIRCGACLNACPVYQQTGGHAYGSIYAGPIGAILTPQLQDMKHSQSLPYASSLCGACYEVCPVKIDIPEILIHLRAKAVEQGYGPLTERMAMRAAAFALADGARLGTAQKLARIAQLPFERAGELRHLPGMLAGWTEFRDLESIPAQSFREWWAERPTTAGGAGDRFLSPAEAQPSGAGHRFLWPAEPSTSTTRAADYAAVPRRYKQAGTLDKDEQLTLFTDRLEDYGCGIYRCAEAGIAETVRAILLARGKNRLLVPEALPPAWLPDGCEFLQEAPGLTYQALDGAQGVITGCAAAIALTGTIVLVHGLGHGNRALTLIPDYHLCLVFEQQVVETVAEGLITVRGGISAPPTAPITTIAGPSATADIEMTRVQGVHGPRSLDVLLVAANRPAASNIQA